MNNQHLADVINKLLVGLSQPDIQQVLSKVLHDQAILGDELNCSHPTFFTYVRRKGRLNKISKNPEMEAFINSLPYYLEQKEILAKVIEKFGADKAPSRTGLCRYFMALRKTV